MIPPMTTVTMQNPNLYVLILVWRESTPAESKALLLRFGRAVRVYAT